MQILKEVFRATMAMPLGLDWTHLVTLTSDLTLTLTFDLGDLGPSCWAQWVPKETPFSNFGLLAPGHS